MIETLDFPGSVPAEDDDVSFVPDGSRLGIGYAVIVWDGGHA
jgi:hypothetical protein